MSGKTALVTGATGFLGRQVVKAFQSHDWTVKGTGYSRADGVNTLKVDLANPTEIEKVLEEVKCAHPTPHSLYRYAEPLTSTGEQTTGGNTLYVFSPPPPSPLPPPPSPISNNAPPLSPQPGAANRFPDKVDADPSGTRALNIEASRALAQQCAARGTVLIYISTDYVFAGRPGDAPYEADAPTGPTNLYGQTKLDGEGAVLGAFESLGREGGGVVLRVPVLYGEVEGGRNGESAVNVLMDVVLGEGKAGGMDHWALRYPTNTEDVARVCYGGFFFFFFFFF